MLHAICHSFDNSLSIFQYSVTAFLNFIGILGCSSLGPRTQTTEKKNEEQNLLLSQMKCFPQATNILRANVVPPSRNNILSIKSHTKTFGLFLSALLATWLRLRRERERDEKWQIKTVSAIKKQRKKRTHKNKIN